MELVVTTFNLSDEDLEEESLLQASKPNKRATKRARTEAIFFMCFSFNEVKERAYSFSAWSDKEADEKEDGRSEDNTRPNSDVEAIANKESQDGGKST